MLRVIDRDSTVIGQVPVRVGLRTSNGKVSRFTEKTVWTIGRQTGSEIMHRRSDGPLPSVPRGWAGRDFIPFVKSDKQAQPKPQTAQPKPQTAQPKPSPVGGKGPVVSPQVVIKALEELREQYRSEGMTEPMIYSGISSSPAQAVTYLMAAPEVAERLADIIGKMAMPR
jgi:hypothetical protein